MTISHVAEAIPEKLQATVYLSAFLLPNGMLAGAVIGDPKFPSGDLGKHFMADPREVGATRLDPRSQDAGYIAGIRTALYHDVPDDRIDAILNLLHPDEAGRTAGTPMKITPERYGTVKRHYISMTDDRTILPETQHLMIKLVDGSGIGGTTILHRMPGSHSPFFAQPDALLDVLMKIAA